MGGGTVPSIYGTSRVAAAAPVMQSNAKAPNVQVASVAGSITGAGTGILDRQYSGYAVPVWLAVLGITILLLYADD